MKKNFINLFILPLVFSFLFLFVGCNKNTTTTTKEIKEKSSVVSSAKAQEGHTHNYGSMYYEREATFFEDGNIAYYYCEGCGKYFDQNKNEVSSVVIPKLSSEISLLVNGTKVADFSVVAQEESVIVWSKLVDNLKKGDLIEVADKADNTKKYSYFANTQSNITKDNKVHNDVDRAEVRIIGTLNGLQLTISGFEYDGITVKVYRGLSFTEYPMSEISYNFGVQRESYIYGYLVVEKDDLIEIVDHDNKVTYGYSSVYSEDLWNTYLFTEGSSNKILINKSTRIGIEFDKESHEIYIDAVYNPNSGESYSLDIYGKTPISLTKKVYEKSSAEYEAFTYVITNEKTINNLDILDALNQNGLVIYNVTVDLNANDKFRIKNDTKNTYVSNDHILDLYNVTNPSSQILLDGDYIKVSEDSKLVISYIECVDGINIQYFAPSTPQPQKVELNISSANPDTGLIRLTQSASNDKVYEIKEKELLESDVFSILYNANNYAYSDIEVGQDLVTSIASAGYAFLMPKKAGTYNISFNVETLKISIVLVKENTENVLVSCKLYDGQSLHNMVSDGDEFKYTLDATSGMYFGFIDQDANSVDDAVLSEPYDASKITMLSSMIFVIDDVNVTVYIHKTTHVVRIVVNE